MRLTLAALAALCAAAPTVAQDDDLITLGGQPAPPPVETERTAPPGGGLVLRPAGLFFASLDANGDFAVSTAEIDMGLTTAFGYADRNGSGDLTLIEYADFAEAAFGARDAQPGVLGFDRDQNNIISAAEFREGFDILAARLAPEPGAPIPFSALVVDEEELRARARPRRNRSED